MFKFCKLHENRLSARKAWTLIELLAVMFVILFAGVVSETVRKSHGQGLSLLAGFLGVLVGVLLVIIFYRWSWSRDKRTLAQLRENYRNIYQVKELPADAKRIVKPEEAEIKIGDFGWDARPNRRDGLIHLQGLTAQWQVVWHAGFRPDQIEKVAIKPVSQYDYWAPDWAKPSSLPPCPYSVRERNTPTMGLPHHSGHYFKNYPSRAF